MFYGVSYFILPSSLQTYTPLRGLQKHLPLSGGGGEKSPLSPPGSTTAQGGTYFNEHALNMRFQLGCFKDHMQYFSLCGFIASNNPVYYQTPLVQLKISIFKL